MNSIQGKAYVLIRRLLRCIPAHKLHAYPSLRKLLVRFSDSKSAAVHLADSLSKQVTILYDGREQPAREILARLRSGIFVYTTHKFSLCLELSRSV